MYVWGSLRLFLKHIFTPDKTSLAVIIYCVPLRLLHRQGNARMGEGGGSGHRAMIPPRGQHIKQFTALGRWVLDPKY